jgi:hypothetical protein
VLQGIPEVETCPSPCPTLPAASCRSSYLDVTSPIVDTGQAIMVKTDPQTLGPEVFLLPFDGNLWATLMLSKR